MKEQSKEFLNQLGVYELRTYARNVGVKSPTTKNKQENIEAIIKVQSGQVEPEWSKKGRKISKRLLNGENFAINIERIKLNYLLSTFEINFENIKRISYLLIEICNELEKLSK